MLRKEGCRVSEVRAEVSNGGPIQAGARQILVEAVRSLALSGNGRTQAKLRELSHRGVKYAAFLPADESAEQNGPLWKLAATFNEKSAVGI